MQKMKVGIPRAFFYYIYYPAWRAYFESLGYEVVTSPPTTKEVIDLGIRDALAEACVPVKVFFGHVQILKDKVDYLFVPRIISMNGKTIYCPKFLGLPDMIRAAVHNLPHMIDVTIDARKDRLALPKAAISVAKELGHSVWEGLQALRKAIQVHKHYEGLLRTGVFPSESIPMLFPEDPEQETVMSHTSTRMQNSSGYHVPLKLAVIGYPYTVHDGFITVNLLQRLRDMDVEVVTMEMMPTDLLEKQNGKVLKRLFWTFSDKASRTAFHFFEHKGEVDGIIHVTAFGCGPDFMVDKLMEIEAKKMHGQVPFMSLSVDEHTGEAGLATRIEAFCEMVRRRKEAAV
ncbi:MAG: acyl-CoA dehydratase activase-related protein [Desulfitobacteriaceae bacterium]